MKKKYIHVYETSNKTNANTTVAESKPSEGVGDFSREKSFLGQ